MTNLKKSKPNFAELLKLREAISMQHTRQSAIAQEFKSLSNEEKSVMMILLYKAISTAIQTKTPVTPIHSITPQLFNDLVGLISTGSTDKDESSLEQNFSLDAIKNAVDSIFERELNFHEYDSDNCLMICRSRIIPQYELIFDESGEATGIACDLSNMLVEQLNQLLTDSDGTADNIYKIVNKLLSDNDQNIDKSPDTQGGMPGQICVR